MYKSQETTIIQRKEMLESFNSETKELRETKRDMQTYIGSCNN